MRKGSSSRRFNDACFCLGISRHFLSFEATAAETSRAPLIIGLSSKMLSAEFTAGNFMHRSIRQTSVLSVACGPVADFGHYHSFLRST